MGYIVKRVEVSETGGYDSVGTIADITVTGAATAIAANVCKLVVIQNTGANSIRIGGASITATRGILLAAGESAELKITNTSSIYHIPSGGDSTISVEYFN